MPTSQCMLNERLYVLRAIPRYQSRSIHVHIDSRCFSLTRERREGNRFTNNTNIFSPFSSYMTTQVFFVFDLGTLTLLESADVDEFVIASSFVITDPLIDLGMGARGATSLGEATYSSTALPLAVGGGAVGDVAAYE
jgi:hypothetical protein